jgi:hypothetical protein
MGLATDMVKSIKPDDKRHWLMNALATDYMKGINGLKKNSKKSIKLFQRAAELGNMSAQETLSHCYFYGVFVPKCLQKARYYAEKAADQGAPSSQYILAELIKVSDNNSAEEVFRLYTLAAFQGSEDGRYALGMYYHGRYDLMKIGDQDWRRNVLLTVYWFGKAAEIEDKTPEGCRSLTLMVIHLDVAMRILWHPPRTSLVDHLPGYSHIPFITWAIDKGGKYAQQFSKRPFDYAWKLECANCGSRKKGELKACARCKAFQYCSKKCQVEHWKDGHKVDCKGHWIEKYFPAMRKAQE